MRLGVRASGEGRRKKTAVRRQGSTAIMDEGPGGGEDEGRRKRRPEPLEGAYVDADDVNRARVTVCDRGNNGRAGGAWSHNLWTDKVRENSDIYIRISTPNATRRCELDGRITTVPTIRPSHSGRRTAVGG